MNITDDLSIDFKNIGETELISKINEFSKLARLRQLTEEENIIRTAYRKEYVKRVTGSLKGHLDNIKPQN